MRVSTFRTSVNIKFDIGNSEFIHRYLPTPSHAEALINISKSLVDSKRNAAHIMIGPYGSGKSLVAALLAGLASKKLEGHVQQELLQKFDKVHQDVYQELEQVINQPNVYCPVTLSGYEGEFAGALLSKIQEVLNEKGISYQPVGVLKNIHDTVQLWQVEYAHTYEQFLAELSTRDLSYEEWGSLLQERSDQEVEWFKEVYSRLTAGATFSSNLKVDFVEQLTALLKLLDENNIGLFIIHDEFGRFLQNLEESEIYKAMQDIQDLGEVANRSNGLLQVLLISHKNMSQYMRGFQEEYRSEFQRVEKRYMTYFVESDTGTYYRVVERYVNELSRAYSFQIPNFMAVHHRLSSFNLFDELNSQEVEQLIVEGSYPVHPLTLFLLPKVSQVFGQNERTLFTFLESNETGGLKNHLENSEGYYYPNNLFDYFFDELNVNGLAENQERLMDIYKRNINKVGRGKKNEVLRKILKFITLWEITDSNSYYPLDEELIGFALGMSREEVVEPLSHLESLKALRYNRVLSKWESHEGSSLVVEELLTEEIERQKISIEQRKSYIRSKLPKKYYLARDYNDIKNITRFARIEVVYSSDLLKYSEQDYRKLEARNHEDAKIFFILLDKKDDYLEMDRLLKKRNNPFAFYVLLRKEASELIPSLDRLIAVEVMLQNTSLLIANDYLKEELILMKEELEYEYEAFFKAYYSFGRNVDWYQSGDVHQFSSEVHYEMYLSEMMDKYYPLTPVIMNDSVNRFEVKGVQKRALHTVLNGVIHQPYEAQLGIEGQGPDYLVYATVMKNNGVSLERLDELGSVELRTLRNRWIQHLEEHPKASLTGLKDIAEEMPFGIRPPLVPLLFMILVRDRLEQLMFYKNDMFVPALESEKVHGMFERAEEYNYVYHNFSSEQISFMTAIEKVVQPYISEYVQDKTILVKVSSGLLNWLRSLPRHVQVTERLDDELIRLKEIIRKSEVNPLESIQELFESYHERFESFLKAYESLESSYALFLKETEQFLLDRLEIDSYSDRISFIEQFSVKEQSFVKLLECLEATTQLEEFLNLYIGVPASEWSDTTTELFKKQLQIDLQQLRGDIEVAEDTIEVQVSTSYKQVKKVALSKKADIIYNNVDRIINNAGRTVPKEELEYILVKLLKEHL